MITRGIRLETKKEAAQIDGSIKRLLTPTRVRIPLKEISGAAAAPIVRAGDCVQLGQKIADAAGEESVSVHASLAGTVSAVEYFPHPLLGRAEAIEILADERGEKIPAMGTERPRWQELSAEELLEIFRESGLVDLENSQALHARAAEVRGQVRALVLNGCEAEPYLSSDYALMMSHALEILKGAEILRRALGAERIEIATQEDKMEAAELFKSKIYFLKSKHVSVDVYPALYPNALETLRLEDGDSAVFNVATAFAVYEAVVLQKPLFERAVTLGGECIALPKNIWLRIGTSFDDAIKLCRGLLREPRKLLMGGPMRGRAVSSLEMPVIKATQGILALPKEVARPETAEACIRCGHCIDACPVEISPVMITLAAEHNLFDVAEDYGVAECIECGNCAYVCPAKRPMTELIRYAASHPS